MVSDGVEDDGQLLGRQEGRHPRQGWNSISFQCTDFESEQKEKEGSKHAFIASWKLKRKDNYYKSTIQ